MAAAFYTTRELQAMLHVDRTTIYRMADAGRLPALKVGSQWRFPRRPIDQWLDSQPPPPPSAPETIRPVSGAGRAFGDGARALGLDQLLPAECVQLVQDTFADALGVMIVMTDLDGRPLTRPSNPPGLVQAVEEHPAAYLRCLQWWAELSRRPGMQPTLIPSHLGLLCARAFFRTGSDLRGMVIFGGIAPEVWPPSPERLHQTALLLGLPVEILQAHLGEVLWIDAGQKQRLVDFVQRLADIVTHMLSERQQHCEKLAHISALTQM